MILPLRIHCFVLFATILRLKMAWRVLAILLNYTMSIIKSFPKIYRNSLNVASRRRFLLTISSLLLLPSSSCAILKMLLASLYFIPISAKSLTILLAISFLFFIVSYFSFRESHAFHLLIYCVGKLLFPLLVLKDQSLRLRIF